MYEAKILADSISPLGYRLTTMEVTYPRFVHSEFMTHRAFSRNAASSRAIPIAKMIERVEQDPVLPVWWGKNQSGMQAAEELSEDQIAHCKLDWRFARDSAVRAARSLSDRGLHKQIANRLLEPWMWITVIVSATEWQNFFHLRCHPDAQPELQKIAYMMQELYNTNTPKAARQGDWHAPLVHAEDITRLRQLHDNDLYPDPMISDVCKVSVGRCARVSYITHDGTRDIQADIDLHNRLLTSGHWSPFEHVAQAGDHGWSGNFQGWIQYRKTFEGENYIASHA